MIQGHNIIAFCNDWDGDPLSKKQIVQRLARHNRILWVNSTGNRNPQLSAHDLRRAWKKLREFVRGCRGVAENIWLFCPLVIPFHASAFARRFNRWALGWSLRRAGKRLGFEDPLVLTFVPTSADVVGQLEARIIVYYCVDEYSQFSGANADAILQHELRLIGSSDLVVVSATRLLQTKSPHHANTCLITHGVDVEHFRKACLPDTPVPEDCPAMQGPVIGFFGLIENWVDLNLIRRIAMDRPNWNFLLIGEIRTDVDGLRHCPNVHLLGRKPYQSLPGYCKRFDVAILPFVENDLTLAANPLKLREYLAAGLPVVATPLPEVRKLEGLVHLARTPAEYIRQIDTLLGTGKHGPHMGWSLRMDNESWDYKVEELSRHIQRTLSGKPVAPAASLQKGQAA